MNDTYPIYSPANGKLVGHAPVCTNEDLEIAVWRAQTAFPDWSRKTAYQREKVIHSASAFVRTKSESIALLMAQEQGKPLAQCLGEVQGACDTIDYFAAEAPRIEGTINPTETANLGSWVKYAPVGVCGLLTPWNYPVALLSWKLGPMLAAGCTGVVKPTPITPLSPRAFCEALVEGGIPEGVLNVITGPDSELGEALVAHPAVAKIAMTGSTVTGKKIAASCASSLKKLTLELGGHCPAIVCADADLDLAAKLICYKGFRNMGQSCSAINRVYVHESIAADLIERTRVIAEAMTIGDGISNPKVDLGPMTTADALAKVECHVADALDKGATLVCGGRRPSGDEFSCGHFYSPTVLTGLLPTMLVAHEETFGPLVPFASFTNLDDAISLANGTRYGLVAYLFANDLGTIMRTTERLSAGTICVNNGAVNTNYGPYEGWGDSGYGIELGRASIYEYLKTKHIKVTY